MRLKEQKLWDRMRPALSMCGVLVERYENLVGVGNPDVEALCNGIVTWMELKAKLAAPARPDTRLLGDDGLSQDQKNWHLRWHKHGGRSLIVIGLGAKHDFRLFAIDGRYHDNVNEWPLRTIEQMSVAKSWGSLAYYLGART